MSTKKSSGRLQLRKKPQQERSIQRLDAIMEAAVELIAANGVGKLKMTDLAQRAGVPIGSLYQFFPEKAAIIRALHDRHTAGVQAVARDMFGKSPSRAQALDLADAAVINFYQTYRNDPIYLPVWTAGMADADLRQLNSQHLETVSQIIYESLIHLVAEQHHAEFKSRITLLLYLSGATIRFAMMQPEAEAQAYIREWLAAIRRSLFEF
ncbi:MAG: TetR/AcrR family transcriptional regulator [Rhizobium sp.]|nr:TetR/AcrR family transcriptional regulator [Rhizobium sp.]